LHTVGILFVRGLGQRLQSVTLQECGQPLIDWVQDWLKQPDGAAGRGSAKVVDVVLNPTRKSEPAHALFEVQSGDRKTEWLLAESWSAPRSTIPRFFKLAVWILTVGAWLVLSHSFKHVYQRTGTFWRQFWRRIWAALTTIGFYGPLALALELGVLGLIVLAALPVPAFRRLLSGLLLGLTGRIGDVYMLLENPMLGESFVSKARRDIHWLQERCQEVIVVAQSQGAALAHRALRRLETQRRVKLLVTIGSGLGKIEELDLVRRTEKKAIAFALAFVVAQAVWLAALVAVVGNNDSSRFLENVLGWTFFTGLACFTVLLLTMFFIGRTVWRRIDERIEELGVPAGRWVDYYASSDPLPNGALTRRTHSFRESVKVINRRSIVTDHKSYWRNRDELIPSLALEIDYAISAGLFRQEDMARCITARRWRHWRVRILSSARVLCIVVTYLFAAALSPQLYDFGQRVAQTDLCNWLIKNIFSPFLKEDQVKHISALIVAGFIIVGLLVAWYRLSFLVWSWWDKLAAGRLLQPASQSRLPRAMVISFLVAIATVPLIVMVYSVNLLVNQGNLIGAVGVPVLLAILYAIIVLTVSFYALIAWLLKKIGLVVWKVVRRPGGLFIRTRRPPASRSKGAAA
jgi:hypothetical protein